MIFLLLLLAMRGTALEQLGITSVQVNSQYNSNNKSQCCNPTLVLDGHSDTFWMSFGSGGTTTHWLVVTLARPTKVVRKVVIVNRIIKDDEPVSVSERINNTQV